MSHADPACNAEDSLFVVTDEDRTLAPMAHTDAWTVGACRFIREHDTALARLIFNGTCTIKQALRLYVEKQKKADKKRKARLVTVLDILRDKGWEPGRTTNWDAEEVEKNYGLIMQAGLSMKNLLLACVVSEILACEQPDTVRGVMYQAVSAGWLPDTSKRSYGQIQRLLVELRKKGVIPYAWIVDNIRSTEKPSSWSGLEDFADTVSEAYRKDLWAGLPDYVCVIAEKDTIAGRISEITREFDVPMHPLRGFSSASFAWGIGEGWRKIEKPIHVLYIGDHDPSGYGIEQSIRENLIKFSGRNDFTWARLAVTADQFEQFKILPLAVKMQDKRANGFVKQYGERCAEVEAVPASALREMVRNAIESHIPQDQWEKLKAIEAEEKKSWHEVMANIGNRVANAGATHE